MSKRCLKDIFAKRRLKDVKTYVPILDLSGILSYLRFAHPCVLLIKKYMKSCTDKEFMDGTASLPVCSDTISRTFLQRLDIKE